MAKKEQEPKVEQPTLEQQRELKSVVENLPTEVGILRTKKKYKIRWICNGAIAKITKLLIHSDDTDNADGNVDENVMKIIVEDSKLACKAAACFVLNGYWKIKFKYWFLWRWFYYIRQYDGVQLQPILAVGKKKLPVMHFYGTTTLLIGVRDSLMQMRVQEVERIQLERATEQLSTKASTGNTSSERGTSSSDS